MSGNGATSSPVMVSIGQRDTTPPEIQVPDVAYDGKNLTISASASDAQGAVRKVEFYVDGKLKATDMANPWSAALNAKPLDRSSHSIQARAYDAAGNIGISGSVMVTTRKRRISRE